MSGSQKSLLLRYSAPFVAVALGVLLRLLLLDRFLGDSLAFITLFPAVALTAWYGGRGPAVLSIFLALVAADYLIMAPRGEWSITRPEDRVGLLVFAVMAGIIGAVAVALRHAQERAEAGAELLRRSQAVERITRERLSLAVEAGRLGVWEWDLRSNDIWWSENLEAIHGLPRGSFGGTLDDFQRLIHPEDRERVNQAIASGIETGGDYDIEFRNLWPDGSVHWMAGKGKVFMDHAGRPVRTGGHRDGCHRAARGRAGSE